MKGLEPANEWTITGFNHGWVMPCAPWWKRLPLVRHVRAIVAAVFVGRWYRFGPGSIGVDTGYDRWVLWGIFHGRERGVKTRVIE